MQRTNRTTVRLVVLALAACGAAAAAIWIRGAGSADANPCLEPLRWRVGRVDARFGLSRGQFREAVEAAVAVWESTTDRRLFRHDSIDGWPVELVYDHRQTAVNERRDRRARILALDDRIERGQRVHEHEQDEFDRARERYDREAAALREAIRSHNATVERWNARGGAPPAEAERIRARAAEIERMRSDVERLEASLEERGRRLDAEAARLQRLIEEYNGLVGEHERTRSPRVEAGSFERTVVTRGAWTTRTDRRVTIYRFGGPEELRRVLVHELGHALGIAHVADSAAVMDDEYDAEEINGPLQLRDADVVALIERCGIDAWREAQ